jgi:ubiquinone/menaquinone biosynthesis C-methylase UbiE
MEIDGTCPGVLEDRRHDPSSGRWETTLLEEVPKDSRRILDLGCGDGRLMSLLLQHCFSATGVALDFSAVMLGLLRERFGSDNRIRVMEHDLDRAAFTDQESGNY